MPVRPPVSGSPAAESPTTEYPGRARRVAIVLRWPLGLARVTWRYMWRTTPVHRVEEEGGADDMPPPLPDEVRDDRLQTLADGVGPMLHRRYRVRVVDTPAAPDEVVGGLEGDPNTAAPADVAVFLKTVGRGRPLTIGDEFVVRMPGPWNGPVRVVQCGRTRFRLATLRGHLEAGQIEFSAERDGDGLVFRIESWARAGDRLSDLMYNRLRLAKEIQLNLWTETCIAVAARSGGRLEGGVRVHTRWVTDPDAPQA